MKLVQIYFLIAGLLGAPNIVRAAVELAEPPVKADLDGAGIKKLTVYEDAYVYVHFGEIKSESVARIKEAFAANPKSKGLVLDLRFAGGTNLAAAASVADLFVSGKEALISIGSEKISSSAGNDGVSVPSAILINSQTSGAAEVLAAILQQNKGCLTFGSATAGTNSYPEDILVKGQPIEAVRPDIVAKTPAEEEMIYLADPYKNINPSSATNTTEVSSLPPVRRRMNEAELVRSQRTLEEETAERPEPRVIRDPVLARGLDFLKAVNLLQVKRG